MLMKLVVQSGAGSGREYLLQREVVRVGSSPGCDVVIDAPELPPHAFTLQQREESVEILIRGDAPYALNRKPVKQGAIWTPGGLLTLGNLGLRLEEHQGTNSVRTNPAARELTDPDEDEESSVINSTSPSPSVEKKPSGSFSQMVIILICLVGGGMLLMRGDGGSSNRETGGTAKKLSFYELLAQTQERGKTDLYFSQLHQDLLSAYRYEQAENKAQAKQVYRHLTQLILSRIPQKEQGEFVNRKTEDARMLIDYLEDDLEKQVYEYALIRQ